MSSLPFRVAVGLSVAAVAGPAAALQPIGSRVVDARVPDANDRVFALASAAGNPLLVVYEDRDSTRLNASLKAELERLAHADARYRHGMVTAAVADVRGYDYWPVKGFVKDAVRDESKKRGTPIYIDWDGKFGNALSLQRGTSNVLFYGRDGRLRFAKSGILSAAEIERLVSLIRVELDAT